MIGSSPVATMFSQWLRCGLAAALLALDSMPAVHLLFPHGGFVPFPCVLSVGAFRLPSLSGGLPSAMRRALSGTGTGAPRFASRVPSGCAAGFAASFTARLAAGFGSTTTGDGQSQGPPSSSACEPLLPHAPSSNCISSPSGCPPQCLNNNARRSVRNAEDCSLLCSLSSLGTRIAA